MGFFDWLFGDRKNGTDDARLNHAIDRVIEGTDPRLRAVSNVRDRLAPAVAHALAFAHDLAARLPAGIELTAENWTHVPLLKAMFVRPADITHTISVSQDLREFLASEHATGIDRIHCVVAATRTERTVLGAVMDGDTLRQDVAQKTVGFNDFRLVGFSASEEALRARLEDIVLEGLVLAALRDIAENKQRGEQLDLYRQLMLTRLRLLEQSGAGLESMVDASANKGHNDRDIDRLRRELAENGAELSALKPAAGGFDSVLQPVIDALGAAETVVGAKKIALHLNAMNIVVGPDDLNASAIELLEISTANPGRPRRVGFLASFPRDAVVMRHVDFDAALRSL